MKVAKFLLAALIHFTCTMPVYTQDLFKGYEQLFTPPRSYTTFRATEAMVIDGNPSEQSWSKVSWSEYFTDIEGVVRVAPAYKTRFKLLWDTACLYVFVELEEPHGWASIRERDAIIYQDNDIEIFIDPDGDTHEYYEIELNAYNTVFDLFMPRPYRNGGKAQIKWDADGFKSAIHVNGTLNDPSDKDKNWLVEMAIPFRSLNAAGPVRIPSGGDTWRINFSRVQWDLDVKDGKYVKKMDSTRRRPLPEHNWVWSPQGVVNMHYPERWGHVLFSAKPAGAASTAAPVPTRASLKNYLWLLYYKQQGYRRKNGQYAGSLQELQLPATIKTNEPMATLELQSNGNQFKASILGADGVSWEIDETGKILPTE